MRRIHIGRVLLFGVVHFALFVFFSGLVMDQVWGDSDAFQLQRGQYITHLLPIAALSLPLTVTHDEFSDPYAELRAKGYYPVVGVVTRTETTLIPASESYIWWLNSLVWGFCLERWFNVLASLRRRRRITLFRRGKT